MLGAKWRRKGSHPRRGISDWTGLDRIGLIAGHWNEPAGFVVMSLNRKEGKARSRAGTRRSLLLRWRQCTDDENYVSLGIESELVTNDCVISIPYYSFTRTFSSTITGISMTSVPLVSLPLPSKLLIHNRCVLIENATHSSSRPACRSVGLSVSSAWAGPIEGEV